MRATRIGIELGEGADERMNVLVRRISYTVRQQLGTNGSQLAIPIEHTIYLSFYLINTVVGRQTLCCGDGQPKFPICLTIQLIRTNETGAA